MFSCFHLRRRQQCSKPKIGGETLVITNLSSEWRKEQIHYRTMCERSIMWYCSHELLSSSFEMAWLHFETRNLDERSLYFRHKGHEMMLKFMTQRRASKDQHRLKEKIETERIGKKRNINCRRKGNWRKRKGRRDKDNGKGCRETSCLIEGHRLFSCIRLRKRQQCCKPKIGGETLVTNKLSSESSKDQIQYSTMCERSIMWYCSHELLSSSFEMCMTSF